MREIREKNQEMTLNNKNKSMKEVVKSNQELEKQIVYMNQQIRNQLPQLKIAESRHQEGKPLILKSHKSIDTVHNQEKSKISSLQKDPSPFITETLRNGNGKFSPLNSNISRY